MIAHLLIVVLVSIYATIVASTMRVPEGAWQAFKQRSERYLDTYRCDGPLQPGPQKNA